MKKLESQKDFPKLEESLKFRCTKHLHERVREYAKDHGFSTVDECLRFLVNASV